MKPILRYCGVTAKLVAPHGGAWIETERRVKKHAEESVAPHGGAWIETENGMTCTLEGRVAPHGGAWIETLTRPP